MNTKQFITAGNATFTLEVPESFAAANGTSPHYTYNVRHKAASGSYGEAWFVTLLTGPDNTNDFTYVGMMDANAGTFRTTAKSALPADAMPLRLLGRLLARVWADEEYVMVNAGFRIHHEGQCGRCGRALTTPESVESGIGPECAKMMGCGRPSRRKSA